MFRRHDDYSEMELHLENLKRQCEQNEESLRKLEERSAKLPRTTTSWFYLDINKLRQKKVNKSLLENSSGNGFQPFVQVLSTPNKIEVINLEDISEEQQTEPGQRNDVQVGESQADKLIEVLNDPKLPEGLREYITQKNGEALDECKTVSFCQYLMESGKSLSEASGTRLLKQILYPMISNLKTTFVSVLLLAKIQELATAFPSFVVDGVIIPLIANDMLGKQQLDVISHMLKGMREESFSRVSKSILTALTTTDENAFKLLQTLVNGKPNTDTELAVLLITRLKNFSPAYASNIQLGKILIAVIPLLDKKLSEGSLEILTDIVEEHRSFFKGQAVNLLNQLHPL